MNIDEQLKREVIAELNSEFFVNAEHIVVEVKDRIVTLSGHVSGCAEKWDAQRLAQRVSGVEAWVIEIDIKFPVSSKRKDNEIARAAENVLQSTTYLPKDGVKVSVESGWLTLSGEVDWDYQRQAAAGAVRHLMRVEGVINNIAVKPKLSLRLVQSGVKSA